MIKLIVTAVALFSFVAMAEREWPNHLHPDDVVQSDEGQRNLARFSRSDGRIAPDSECWKLLVATQERLGRELTFAEIKALLPRVLKTTGEQLVTTVKRSPSKRRHTTIGLAESMHVVTPRGSVNIQDLNEGDEVLSYNHFNRKFTIHAIKRVFSGFSEKLGILPCGTTLSINVRVLTYHSEFRSLDKLSKTDDILKLLTLSQGGLGFYITSRGQFRLIEPANVHHLELEDGPGNFIANGVVVKALNIKGSKP
jgi:hypothetical protein